MVSARLPPAADPTAHRLPSWGWEAQVAPPQFLSPLASLQEEGSGGCPCFLHPLTLALSRFTKEAPRLLKALGKEVFLLCVFLST